MGADEPLELLKLARLTDEQVLGDRVQLLGGVDGRPLGLDDSGVDDIQGTEVLDGIGPADRVVVPVALRDERARGADGRPAERA